MPRINLDFNCKAADCKAADLDFKISPITTKQQQNGQYIYHGKLSRIRIAFTECLEFTTANNINKKQQQKQQQNNNRQYIYHGKKVSYQSCFFG